MEYLQKLHKLNERLSRNVALRGMCIEIMQDMTRIGNEEMHLKYMEKYDSLKAELMQIDKEYNEMSATDAA